MAAGALAGCTLSPKYQRADLPVAQAFPDAPASPDTTAHISWKALFLDPKLQATIEQALQNNRDLRAAAFNVDKTRAQYGIATAALLPGVNGNLGETYAHTPASTSQTGVAATGTTYSANLAVTGYELDIFGRVRSLKTSAVETFFAARENRNAVEISLISQVATAWLSYAADADSLALNRQTLKAYQDTYDIAQGRARIGVLSDLDAAAIEVQLQTARATVAAAETRLDQDRSTLALLVGAEVGNDQLPSGLGQTQLVADTLPVGLPSDVLLDRPDVLSSEHALKSANANIGAARAAFFPRITLTGSTGAASHQLDGLFDAHTGAYSFAPSISLPIFAGGANRWGLKGAKASRDVALTQYEKAIQSAFNDVSQALAVRARIDERLDAQSKATNAATRAATLSQARYQSGADSYLSYLDAQRNLYTAQQNLITLQLLRASNLAVLYKAVGDDESLN